MRRALRSCRPLFAACLCGLLALWLAPLTPAEAGGAITRCRDARGILHLTNVPGGKCGVPTAAPRRRSVPPAVAPVVPPPAVVPAVQSPAPAENTPQAIPAAVASQRQECLYIFRDRNGISHLSNMAIDGRYQKISCTWVRNTPLWLAGPGNKPGGSTGKTRRLDPALRDRYHPDILRVAGNQGLDPALLHAVITAESAYNPQAVSRAGAMGMMQLMPATAARFGVDNPYDPTTNIEGGARYLRLLLNQFGNLDLALAAYNAGEQNVIRYGMSIPPFQETRDYVVRVRELYQRYRTSSP